jgi:hypothetical protein
MGLPPAAQRRAQPKLSPEVGLFFPRARAQIYFETSKQQQQQQTHTTAPRNKSRFFLFYNI